jgi:pyruvate,orthophosphate dikinase
MREKPVTIRTLDPPLHEFLPAEKDEKDIQKLATKMGIPFEQLFAKVVSLHEANPMLGHRGCRLGVTYPEITRMQARAIMEAACEVAREGMDVRPEIMIPLVGDAGEFKNQRDVVEAVAREVMQEYGVDIEYHIGTMIEVPRGALTADEIAEHAEFFSFGTNDLTQTVFGISRDDAGKFLPVYLTNKIWEHDPFARLDQKGVGGLMEIAVRKGRSVRRDIKIGICGEHGGDPSSVEFCHRIGLDYVSCSPYRIPIATLAAAQAAIKEKREKEDSEDTVKSFLPSNDLPVDDQLADQEAKAILHEKLMLFGEQLKGKEAVIFAKRLLTEDPMTLQEIGEKFGISRERVRQIESRLKKKLKAYLEEEITDIDLLQQSMIEI